MHKCSAISCKQTSTLRLILCWLTYRVAVTFCILPCIDAVQSAANRPQHSGSPSAGQHRELLSVAPQQHMRQRQGCKRHRLRVGSTARRPHPGRLPEGLLHQPLQTAAPGCQKSLDTGKTAEFSVLSSHFIKDNTGCHRISRAKCAHLSGYKGWHQHQCTACHGDNEHAN